LLLVVVIDDIVDHGATAIVAEVELDDDDDDVVPVTVAVAVAVALVLLLIVANGVSGATRIITNVT